MPSLVMLTGLLLMNAGPIVEESKRMKKNHSLLSYTILSIPKNLARMKRFEHAYAAARHHITYFLEMVPLSTFVFCTTWLMALGNR